MGKTQAIREHVEKKYRQKYEQILASQETGDATPLSVPAPIDFHLERLSDVLLQRFGEIDLSFGSQLYRDPFIKAAEARIGQLLSAMVFAVRSLAPHVGLSEEEIARRLLKAGEIHSRIGMRNESQGLTEMLEQANAALRGV